MLAYIKKLPKNLPRRPHVSLYNCLLSLELNNCYIYQAISKHLIH